MAVGLAKAGLPPDKHIPTLYLLKNHNLIFLGLAMAAGKAIADPARNVDIQHHGHSHVPKWHRIRHSGKWSGR